MISGELKTQNLTKDFRRYLQAELIERCRKNPSYSLRAFAKSLNIYHATLSAILAGKRPLTETTIKKLAEALALNPQQTESFLKQIKKDPQSQPTQKEKYHELTMDTFIATSEWYYDAILELMRTKGFQSDPKWIAKRLGLTVNEVNIAIERLIRLEMLEVNAKGKWLDPAPNSTTIIHNDFTTTALRKYQKRILELSSTSLDEVEKSLRDHSSVTLSVQKKDLEETKERIKKFRRELSAFLQRKGTQPDEVYQLAISFFPLTKIPNPGGF